MSGLACPYESPKQLERMPKAGIACTEGSSSSAQLYGFTTIAEWNVVSRNVRYQILG